jgi:hypothetical protein
MEEIAETRYFQDDIGGDGPPDTIVTGCLL